MSTRSFTPLDRVLCEIDKAIKVLAAPAHASRALPGSTAPEPELTALQRSEAARLMRVNHSGEVAAQALYRGQAIFARDPQVEASLREAAREEMDHLAWCEARLGELGGRTSWLNPLWYAGSFALGAIAGTLGDARSLGFITETEAQVENHLRDHLGRLPAEDQRSRAILAQMTHDEARHGANAESLGGTRLPRPVRALMHLGGRVMTRSAYWI